MGATATTESLHDQPKDWELLDLEYQFELEPSPQVTGKWIDSDSVSALSYDRAASDQTSAEIMESRMQSLRVGDTASVPYAVNPLTTAALAVEARNRCGTASAEYAEKRRGIVLDSERLLAEAYRKLSWEYFARERQAYDPVQRSYIGYGRALMDIVNNGITPVAEPEEQECRIAERREEVTVRQVGEMLMKSAGVLPPGSLPEVTLPDELPELSVGNGHKVSIHTISECPQWAIDEYKKDPDGAFDGYAPAIEKLMLRAIHIDPADGSRYEEQIGMSGLYVTHEVVNQALKILDVVQEGTRLTKSKVRGKQIINTDGNGVIEMAQLLDQLASEASGRTIFMGEPVEVDHPKDYDAIPVQAATRQAKQQRDAEALADYVMELAENKTDGWAANAMVGNFVKKQMFEAVKDKPEEAAIAFDEKTALGIREIAHLRFAGRMEDAESLERRVEASAPPAGFCGAGSCGIVGVGANSAEGIAAKALGLKAEKGELLKDTVRSCPDCKTMKVMYDNRGNKACTNTKCGLRQVNGQVSGGKSKNRRDIAA